MKPHFFSLLVIFCFSCTIDDRQPDYIGENDKEIREYLAINNLEAKKTSSGLYYIIEEEGTGRSPIPADEVRVAYKGYFTNGGVFDESPPEGISFILRNAIVGWTEGLTYFKEGGSGILLIPAHLAYGNEVYREIPAASVLIFEIDLLKVN